MKNKSNTKQRGVIFISVVPGIGHIILGYRSRGINLFVFAISMVLVLIWRWERFLNVFYTKDIGGWVASAFIILSLVGSVVFSVVDVKRLLLKHDDEIYSKSPMRVALRRFKANRLAVASLYVIILLYILAILAPIVAPYDPVAIDNVLGSRYLPPSPGHPFGTDELGRDLVSRALYGARVSLSVGFLATVIAISFGTVYGAAAGFFGKAIDNVLMRIVDVIISFPTTFLLLMLVGVFEASVVAMILILGLTSWTGTARFIRGEILSLKKREFIDSARAIGRPNHLILVRHLIPNAMAPVLVSAALMVGGMIGAEAGLSFLGIGIRPPTPSWGNMMTGSKGVLMIAWWVAVFPGSLLAVTILSFNLLADGLRDAMDPKTLMRRYV